MEALDNTNLPAVEKFSVIQDILDQNKWGSSVAWDWSHVSALTARDVLVPVRRILINEISSNHQARTPEGLARNVVLIRELNNNVIKVCPKGLPCSW